MFCTPSYKRAMTCHQGQSILEIINIQEFGHNCLFSINGYKYPPNYKPQNHDVIYASGRLLGGVKHFQINNDNIPNTVTAFPEIASKIRNLRVASWNIRGGLNETKLGFILQTMKSAKIDIFFATETNYDGQLKGNPYGCIASSTVRYDSQNRPHYGTAAFVQNPSLAKELSLVHLDDFMVSLSFQGYVLSGIYRQHHTDIIDFNNKLSKFESMPHIIIIIKLRHRLMVYIKAINLFIFTISTINVLISTLFKQIRLEFITKSELHLEILVHDLICTTLFVAVLANLSACSFSGKPL